MHVLLGRKGLKDIHNPFVVEDVMANVVRIEGNARREEKVIRGSRIVRKEPGLHIRKHTAESCV